MEKESDAIGLLTMNEVVFPYIQKLKFRIYSALSNMKEIKYLLFTFKTWNSDFIQS